MKSKRNVGKQLRGVGVLLTCLFISIESVKRLRLKFP